MNAPRDSNAATLVGGLERSSRDTKAVRDGIRPAEPLTRRMVLDFGRSVVGRSTRRGHHAHRHHPPQAGGSRNAATAGGAGSRRPRDDDGDAVGNADARDEPAARRDSRECSDRAAPERAREPGDSEEVDIILNDVVAGSRRAGSILQRLRSWFSNGRHERERLGLNDVANDVIEILRGDLLDAASRVAAAVAPRCLRSPAIASSCSRSCSI